MKKTIIIGCLFFGTLLMDAQNKHLLFGYGVSSDFLSIPLSEQSLVANSTNVYCTCLLNENLNLKVGFDGLMIKDLNAKKYDQLSGLLLGAGYLILHDQPRNFTTELTLAASNGFDKFSSFRNYHADLGLRMMMFKSFYIGTGMRFQHDERASLITAPLSSYNWYMQMGMQFYIGKR
ncbi:MAG: hypothetical protein VB102_04815 [Paludibacter sp.]|nr:hypothetical protein [Paludibacter sp.]